MKKSFSILLILFTLFSVKGFSADINFESELQEFKKLVQDNSGWYFYQWYDGIYMNMYYIGLGQETKENLYYVDSKCYELNFKSKTLSISSSGGHPYLRNSTYLKEEKDSFTVQNGKVTSIRLYDSYLIKTDCKTEKEAAEYLYKKIDDRMSLILGSHFDKNTGVTINVSKNADSFNVEVTDKNGLKKSYEMYYWNEYMLFCAEEEIVHFIEIKNGVFVFEDMDLYERMTPVGTFEISAFAKETKSIETETQHKGYAILSDNPKSILLDTFDLKYTESKQPQRIIDVYRVYEKDGWKRIDFEDKKIQIIDGGRLYLAFGFTADSLKNDKSLSESVYVKKPETPENFNGYMVKNLKASSTLKDKYHTYSADGMLSVYEKKTNSADEYMRQIPDYWVKDNIPWVEGKADDGIGEYFEFDLSPNNDYRFTRYEIRILNGYVNPLLPNLFKENNRIKTAIVETDKGYKTEIHFEDAVEFTEFFIPMVKDSRTHVKITIKEVYKGSKYSDTAVTALEVNHMLWDK